MSEVFAAVTALRRARNLPRFVALVDGDNELPIDLDNPLLVAAFADEIAGRRHAQLTEVYPAPDHLLVTAEDGSYTNQVILTFTRTRPAVRVAAAPAPAPRIRRAFAPGSEWLYAKIYCGVSTADRVLRDAVGPVLREALAGGGATHWFFVRYADPGHHLRVRLSGDPEALVGTVFPALERALAPLLTSAAVRRWQLDTYERETERYGGDAGIELVERLFSIDSSAVLDIIDRLDGDAGSDARWRLALRGIDGLLGALGLDPVARAHLFVRARDSLGAEHRATPDLWRALGARFARERDELEKLLAQAPPFRAAADAHPLADGLAILVHRDTRIAEIAAQLRERDRAGALTPRLADMAWSLAHMHANRLLHASQRTQEMVLYDFLRRLHATRRALGVSARVREAPMRAAGGAP
jgi:thiopeptide-type bacteriocin biosynthesis protein